MPGNGRRQLTHEGAVRRYGERIPAKVTAQLDKELAIIEHSTIRATS